MTSRRKEKEIQRLWNWPGMTKTLGVSFDHSVLLLLCSKALGKAGRHSKETFPSVVAKPNQILVISLLLPHLKAGDWTWHLQHWPFSVARSFN